jgi:hypothetical protein
MHSAAKPVKESRRRNWLVAVGAALLLCGVIAYRWFYSHNRKSIDEGLYSGYLEGYSEEARKPIAVVFVHGIFGDDTTWGTGNLSLPHLLATEPSLQKKIDIFLFEYNSPYLQDAQKIPSISDQLGGALDDHDVWDKHQAIIFVAHSMGGVVVRQYLVAHRDYLQKVSLLFLYGTPTNGAGAAEVVSHFSANPQVKGLIPLEGNNFLDAVTHNWLGSPELKRIPTWCAYEDQDTDGFRIVPESSAIALCTDIVPLEGDHRQIVKPTRRDDPRFTRLATIVKKSIESPPANSVQAVILFHKASYPPIRMEENHADTGRPWLALDGTFNEPYWEVLRAPKILGQGELGTFMNLHLEMNYQLRNTGSSPALETFVSMQATTTEDSKYFTRPALPMSMACNWAETEVKRAVGPDSTNHGLVIFPQAPPVNRGYGNLLAFREDDFKVVRGAHIAVCVVYKDSSSSKLHHTKIWYTSMARNGVIPLTPIAPGQPYSWYPFLTFVLTDSDAD